MKKVFVTGSQGYIGAHLVRLLHEAGHSVTGCDLDLFEGCEWDPVPQPDIYLHKDVRNITVEDLDGHDCLMHLAALSNDPMGDVDPSLTLKINRDASIELAEKCKRAGVGRFLFSGSCSVYGKGAKLDLDESDPLNPLTAYARSKIDTEAAIFELSRNTTNNGFATASLRNATAYGYSPMLRIDLVVNNLLGSALAYNQIRIHSDGSPWRPLTHCEDIARAFIAFMDAPAERINCQPVNIGGNTENFQVKDVAAEVKRLIPGADITFTGEVGNDPRSYRVKFDHLNQLLPDFKLKHTLASGMDELHKAMVDHGFNAADFEGTQFVRLRTLQQGRIDLLTPAGRA